MLFSILILAVGIIILLASTRGLISISESLAQALKLSPLFIGMTIVAIGTSLPELAVSGIAIARHDTGLALGNIFGSNIINILLVLPVGILLGKLRIGKIKTQRNVFLLMFFTALFLIAQILPVGKFIFGILFVFVGVMMTGVQYSWAVFGRKHEDVAHVQSTRKVRIAPTRIGLLLLAAVGIIVGGYLTVWATEYLATASGYSTTILGLSLTAIVTSLPELLATTFSQRSNDSKIAIGNVIGSNIYNILIIGGIVLLFSPPRIIELKEMLILALVTMGFYKIVRIYRGRVVPRWIGFVLLALFVGYLCTLAVPGQ